MSDITITSDDISYPELFNILPELDWDEFLKKTDNLSIAFNKNLEKQDAVTKWTRDVADQFRFDCKVQYVNLQEFLEKYTITLGGTVVDAIIDTVKFLKKCDDLWYQIFRTPNMISCERLRANIDDFLLMGLTEYLTSVDYKMLITRNDEGDTILMYILKTLECHKYRISLIPILIHRTWSDDPFAVNYNNEDILYIAAMSCPSIPEVAGYIATLYLRDEINVNESIYTPQGISLIHALVERGDSHADVLKELILLKNKEGQLAFDVNITISQNRTPLYMAVVNHKTFRENGERISSLNIVKLLMMSKADPTIRHSETGNTPLHLAILVTRDVAIIKALLTGKGVDALNVMNSQGLTVYDLINELPEESQEKAEIENILRTLP